MANNNEHIVLGLDVPKTARQINADIKKLQKQLKKINVTGALDTGSTVKQINAQIAALQSQLKTINIKAGIDTSNVQKTSDKLEKTWNALGSLGLIPKSMDTLVGQLQKTSEEVINVSSAMAELKKVSNASASEINDYFEKAAGSAKKFGTSVSSMIHAAASWSKSGYSLPDSKKLAETAALYSNISGTSMDSANEALSSALQGFRMTADEALHIIDAFYKTAESEAVDSTLISEALKQSASSMYDAGNTLEETIGLITAASTVLHDPSSIGTVYETISMGIRDSKAELESLGIQTEGMAGSTYQILDELAAKWQDLTASQRDSAAELIAGKEQSGIFSALMDNFETARRATETAVNSTGSALEAQKQYEQEIGYSLNRLEASFQSFANHILDSGFLKGIIDLGSSVVNVLDSVAAKFGSLGTIGVGAGIASFVKNFA